MINIAVIVKQTLLPSGINPRTSIYTNLTIRPYETLASK